MHGRSGPARPRTSRATNMSARQRRSELAGIIANGITRAVAARAEPPELAGESSVDALELSRESRLSVDTRARPARNESKAGECA